MLVLCIFLNWIAPEGITLVKPKPIQPANFRLEAGTAVFHNEDWVCRLRALTPLEFKRYLVEKGVREQVVRQPRIHDALQEVAVFEITFENLGGDRLTFNPDQVMLLNKARPTGILIDTANFWPPSLFQSDHDQETFAHIFRKGSAEIQPSETHEQLLVFRPMGKRLPKRVTFQASRVYYGIVDTTIECRFDVRYPKE